MIAAFVNGERGKMYEPEQEYYVVMKLAEAMAGHETLEECTAVGCLIRNRVKQWGGTGWISELERWTMDDPCAFLHLENAKDRDVMHAAYAIYHEDQEDVTNGCTSFARLSDRLQVSIGSLSMVRADESGKRLG